MILNYFRKPVYSIIMLVIFILSSCSKVDESYELIAEGMTGKKLMDVHIKIRTSFEEANPLKASNGLKQADTNESSLNQDQKEQIEKKIQENITYLNDYGLESLLSKNGINPAILSEIEYFQENRNKEQVYDILAKRFQFSSEREMEFFFQTITIYDFIVQNNKSSFSKMAESDGITWGCALAIAGTVGVSVGTIWLTGGAALVYFAATKTLATVAIVEACGDGWGEI